MYRYLDVVIVMVGIVSKLSTGLSITSSILTSCCNSVDLLSCVNTSISFTNEVAIGGFVFVLFVSPEIETYTANSILVNSLYFESHQYTVRLLSSQTGDDHNPTDKRWNKVKYVSNALRGWAKQCARLVVIDADLLFLNVKDDFVRTIVMQNDEANLILSADAIDVANTGFMIIKNTQWSIDFFDQWWAFRHLRHTHCDQHVLNKMLIELRLNRTSVDRVVVLPEKALNSKWPSVEHFSSTDSVLHLMGETNAVREAVMAHAATVVCNATRSAIILSDGTMVVDVPHQFGLTKEILRTIAGDAMLSHVQSQLKRCSESCLKEHFEQLHASISHFCVDSTKQHQQDTKMSLCLQLLDEAVVVNVHGRSFCSIGGDNDQRALFHLDQIAMLLYDAMRYSPNEGKERVSERVLALLDQVSDAVDMTLKRNQIYLRHKRGLVFGSLAELAQSEQRWQVALQHERVAISEIAAVLGLVDADDPDFQGFVIEYTNAALRLSVTFERLDRLLEAHEWSAIAVNNGELLFADHFAEERTINDELHRLFFQHLSVCRALGDSHREEANIMEAKLSALMNVQTN